MQRVPQPLAAPAAWSSPVPAGRTPLAGWWRGFGDPLLVELVAAAEQANTEVRSAQANLARARALRDAAAAGLGPVLSASVSAQRSEGGGRAGSTLYSAGFDAAWEPDVFGAVGHGVAASDADARASAAALAATQVSVAAEVAMGYLQLRGVQARLALARENLALQEQTLQITQWRTQAGLASSIELAQARTAVEQTRAQLPLLQASAAQAAHALGVLTGQAPEALLPRLGIAAALPGPPAELEIAIPVRTLRQRPDVLAAEAQLQAAAERVAQADAERRPTLQLRASLAWDALTLGSLGSTAAARSLVASLAQPVFDGGQRKAQLAAQQAGFEAAQQAYTARVLAALQEVEDALVALEASRARIAALAAAAESARLAAQLAGQRHASGLVDFQVVLETQRTLLGAQDNLASAQTDWATDHVRLYKALGGGWNP